jgi:hypothetical protein
MPNGVDPLDRLGLANPVRDDAVPDDSLARMRATVQEQLSMSNNLRRDPTTVRPTRGPLAAIAGVALAGALAFAFAMTSGFGLLGTAASPPPVAVVPSPSEDPGGAAGGGAASCLMYDPANLPTFEVVFDGTVTAVEGDQVTFDVETDFQGAGDSITLTAPVVDPALVGPLPDFQVGGRYLVTAIDGTIQACGYTLDYDAATAAEWAAAF